MMACNKTTPEPIQQSVLQQPAPPCSGTCFAGTYVMDSIGTYEYSTDHTLHTTDTVITNGSFDVIFAGYGHNPSHGIYDTDTLRYMLGNFNFDTSIVSSNQLNGVIPAPDGFYSLNFLLSTKTNKLILFKRL